MAHNAYLAGRGSLGSWATGTTVADSEFWYFESGIYKSINGDDGGTWAPTATIVVGGAGVQVTGTFAAAGHSTFGVSAAQTSTFYSEAYFTSAAQFDDPALFTDTAQFNGTVTATGTVALGDTTHDVSLNGAVHAYETVTAGANLEVVGDTRLGMNALSLVDVYGTVTAHATVTASGPVAMLGNVIIGNSGANILSVYASPSFTSPANFASPVAFDGSVALAATVAGNPQFVGNVAFGGSVTATGNVNLGGTYSHTTYLHGTLDASHGGHIEHGVRALGDADTTVGIGEGPIYVQGAISAARTLTISTGEMGAKTPLLLVKNTNATHALLIATSGGTYVGGAGNPTCVLIYYDASTGFWSPLLSS